MDWITVVFWIAGTLVVVLAPIILIHEIGHFIFAKLAGVRIEEFGLGYPPRILKLWRGKGYLEISSTRVTIPAGFRLPKDLGVGTWVDAIAQQRDDGTYHLRRLRALDPLVDDLTLKREHVEENVHVRGELTAMEPGTLYSLNWLPMGGFVRMTGEEDPSDPRSLAAQPKRWRLAVLAAGAVLNIIAALILLTGAYASGYPEKWLVEITDVEPESAAEEARLQPQDVILIANGEHIEEGQGHLRRIIRAVPEQTIELTVLRGEETLTLTATPRTNEEGFGYLGIWMAPWPDRNTARRYPLPEALSASINDIVTTVVSTVQLPARLAQGDVTPAEARPVSIVGISGLLTFTLQQSIRWKLAFFVLHTASITSLALGLTNLLPLPALDGGRILFVLVEAVRGRRIPPEREAAVHFVGLMILVSLMMFMMFRDLVDPFIAWSRLK